MMELPMPGLPGFDYIRAGSPDEVTDLLLQHPDEACLFMGGTDVFVRMREGTIAPQMLIDVKHLSDMQTVSFGPQTGLQLGAAVNMNTMACHPAVMAHYPLLREAAHTVASYQLRTRATMGGNLCNASPAADTAPAALVLDATLIARGPDGARAIPAGEFFLDAGKHTLRPGEYLARIDFPTPPTGWVGRYLKLGRNAAGDLAIAGVAVMGYPDRTVSSGYRFRIALASVAPTPIRVPLAEETLAQEPITAKTLDAAADAAQDAAQPIDDVRASARYRKMMVRTLTRRALADIWGVLQKEN